jgi:hypothetical protein
MFLIFGLCNGFMNIRSEHDVDKYFDLKFPFYLNIRNEESGLWASMKASGCNSNDTC